MNVKLCRGFIREKDSTQVIGEMLFTISIDYFIKIVPTLFPEIVWEDEQDLEDFISHYTFPDAEKIYKQALKDNELISFGDNYFNFYNFTEGRIRQTLEGSQE